MLVAKCLVASVAGFRFSVDVVIMTGFLGAVIPTLIHSIVSGNVVIESDDVLVHWKFF